MALMRVTSEISLTSGSSPPPESKVLKSIAGPIPTCSAQALKAAWSVSPLRHRHHQLSLLPSSFRATLAISILHARSWKLPARKSNSTTSAPSVGSKPPTICQWTNIISPHRLPTSAGHSTPPRRFAPPLTTVSPASGFRMRGTFFTSLTTPPKKTRTFS